MLYRATTAAAVGVLLAGASAGYTQSLPGDGQEGLGNQPLSASSGVRLSIGLGAAVAPDYEGSDNHALTPALTLRAADIAGPDTYVALNGTSLRSNLLRDDHWRLGVSGRYLTDYDDVDDDRVQDLDGVDQALLFGLTAGYDFVEGDAADAVVEVDAQYDVLEGNGGTITPRVRYGARLAELVQLEASVSTTLASQDYTSERFGIGAKDAASSDLDRFDADEGFKNVGLALSATYPLGRSLALTGFGSYNRLLGDAADSPIVDDRGDDDQLAAGVLLSYSF